MRLPRAATARPAFTLLEMILASTIAVLLLGALYVAMDLQLRNAEAARDVVEQTTLARALIQRIAGDITPSLGQIDPSRYRASSGTAGGGGTTAAQPQTGTAAATGTGATTTDATAQATTTGSTTTTSSTSPTLIAFQGDASTLTILVTRVPRAPANAENPEAPGISDLRRVSYSLAGGGSPLGLARQEVLAVTSEEASDPPEEVSDPASPLIVAPEVTGLSFSYWDGTGWLDSWDSTTAGADGTTPVGPPVAIAITLTIAPPSGSTTGEVKTRTYRHVVPIPTANGTTQQPSADTTGTTGTTP